MGDKVVGKVTEQNIKGIGKIPSDWEVKQLNEIAEFITKGATPTTYGFKWENEGIPFFKSDCIKNGQFVYGNYQYISEEAHESLKRSKVKSGDILISITGDVGKVAVIPDSIEEANINQHVAKITINNNEANSSYIYHWLNQKKIRDYYNVIKTGLAFPQISLEQVRKTNIPLPNIKEQEKIVSILSTWDKAIGLKEKLIEQKKEQKKGVIQLLISGNVRVPGFSSEWSKKNVGELIEESKEVAKHPKLSERITVRLSLKGVTKRETTAVEKDGATTQYVRRAGQFIYGKQNLHKGALGLIPKELDGFQSSSDIPAFDFKEGIEPLWFYYYFARENFYESLEDISSGTGSKRIQPKELYKVKIMVPSVEEQKRQAEIFLSLDKEIKLLQQELELLKTQKQGLMKQLLTGKIRVKV